VPILPVVDLLIVGAWTLMIIGAFLKAIYISTSYRPTVLGFTPIDFVVVAALALLFAIALIGRTWIKANQQQLAGGRRRVPHDLGGEPAELYGEAEELRGGRGDGSGAGEAAVAAGRAHATHGVGVR
jgi:membrane protein implicated in regulation of membrane protease activity